jgi:hypothetical protein
LDFLTCKSIKNNLCVIFIMPVPVRYFYYYLLCVLFIFAAGSVGRQTTPLTGRWDEKTVKHSWDAVPQNWESLGHPPVDTTIDLYLALKPQHENALIDALQEVSNPRHAKYVPRHPSTHT